MTRVWRSSSRAVALVFAGLTAIVGCSSPTPDPATPAPTIPEDAIAYDEIKSLKSRPAPFTGDCSPFDPDALRELGLAGTSETVETSVQKWCALGTTSDSPFEEISVMAEGPIFPGDTRAFPAIWDGQTHSGYFRREILLDRYYAVQALNLDSGARCDYVVDVGSPYAVRIAGVLNEDVGMTLADTIRPSVTGDVNEDEAESFMIEYCPRMRQLTEGLLPMIDPDGGSLATR